MSTYNEIYDDENLRINTKLDYNDKKKYNVDYSFVGTFYINYLVWLIINKKIETIVILFNKYKNNIDETYNSENLKKIINGKTSVALCYSALHIAVISARFYDEAIVDLLINEGADVNIPLNPYKKTPLMHAVSLSNKLSNFATVKKLIKAGANVNMKDSKNYTALHFAVENINKCSSIESIIYLVKNGANLFEKTNDGKTIFDIANDMHFWKNNLLQKIIFEEQKKTIEELKLQVKFMPGGEEFKKAEKHFNEMS